jgi:hypothetical protein
LPITTDVEGLVPLTDQAHGCRLAIGSGPNEMRILAEGDQKLLPTSKLDRLGFVGIHAKPTAF